MLTLVWPWLLLLLPLPFIMRRAPSNPAVDTGALQLPSAGDGYLNLKQLNRGDRLHYWLLWLVWILLIITVSRPLWLGDAIEIPSKGRDLMLAVDLSGSMQTPDMVLDNESVDRLTMVQHVMGQFIARRKGDNIGLILFADHAYLQAPLTRDRRSVAQFLREAQIGLVGQQTAIGEAIALAVKRFDKAKKSNRILILLTDGSNNSGSILPQQAAEIAAKRGITIYAIGVGADEMEQRTFLGREKVNPSADLNETVLKQLAATTKGFYFRARNSNDLKQIYRKIDELQPISTKHLSFRPRLELFYYPLAAALFLSILMVLYRQPFMPSFSLFNKGRTR